MSQGRAQSKDVSECGGTLSTFSIDRACYCLVWQDLLNRPYLK